MKTTPILMQASLDEETLKQLHELRAARLGVAKKMLADVEETAYMLKTGGHLEPTASLTTSELRAELEDRLAMMEERAKNPDILYEDELGLYLELLESNSG